MFGIVNNSLDQRIKVRQMVRRVGSPFGQHIECNRRLQKIRHARGSFGGNVVHRPAEVSLRQFKRNSCRFGSKLSFDAFGKNDGLGWRSTQPSDHFVKVHMTFAVKASGYQELHSI